MPGSGDIAHFLDNPNLDERVWATLSQPLNNNDRRLITRAIASVTRKESTVSAKLRLALVALENRNRSLQDQARRLSIDATTCPLTGLNNRRAVDRLITAETSAVIHAPLALGLVDIDRFRDANERFLHTGGDIILQGVSRLLQGTVRETDALGRMGGDEFLIVARETGYEGAVALGERLRQSIASGQFLVDNVNATVTVSVGFAVVGANQPITEAVLRQTAAQALREAKDAGRNKVVVRQINEIASSN
jgi:diguanylate cyclase (GGDEF)-like protein